MNIILLIFDTLRKDCVGAYGSPPWGPVHTPNLDAFAREALVFDRVYPEVLPTLPARRALYTGQRVYPFTDGDFRLKGDPVYAPGWGPMGEDQATLAEILGGQGYRTALISDLYHQFKPSKNFTRGFDQWTFIRGQELDPYRSGPAPSQAEIDHWLAPELQGETGRGVPFMRRALQNMADRRVEEDYFNAQVMSTAARWLQENRDANPFFLTLECWDPHEPWFVPAPYRAQYDPEAGREHVLSIYAETAGFPADLLHRARMNYSGLVTMCDRWFGHLYQTLAALGRLDDTLLMVTSDHGHALGDGGYMGKRLYPTHPAVLDCTLMIRHPEGLGAGQRADMFVQHTDLAAQILAFARVPAPQPLHGIPFWQEALAGQPSSRDHVTVGWGAAFTVIDETWWLNVMVDGTRPRLHPRLGPFDHNLAAANPETVAQLFALGAADAGGAFPEYLLQQARGEVQAPVWDPLAPE